MPQELLLFYHQTSEKSISSKKFFLYIIEPPMLGLCVAAIVRAYGTTCVVPCMPVIRHTLKPKSLREKEIFHIQPHTPILSNVDCMKQCGAHSIKSIRITTHRFEWMKNFCVCQFFPKKKIISLQQ